MGFPKKRRDQIPLLCVWYVYLMIAATGSIFLISHHLLADSSFPSHKDLKQEGYFCPQCLSKCCELPTDCQVRLIHRGFLVLPSTCVENKMNLKSARLHKHLQLIWNCYSSYHNIRSVLLPWYRLLTWLGHITISFPFQTLQSLI